MSDRQLILNLKLEGLGTSYHSFTNRYKAELVIKGYSIRKERWISENAGGIIFDKRKVDLGSVLEIEKKVGKRFRVMLEIRSADDDIRLIAWPSKRKQEIPAVLVDDLERTAKRIAEKMKG